MDVTETSSVTMKDIQSHVVKTIVGTIFAAFVIAISFYFKTSYDMSNQKEDITQNKLDIIALKKALSDATLDIQKSNTPTVVNQVQITNLQNQMEGFEVDLERLESKIDQLIQLQLKK